MSCAPCANGVCIVIGTDSVGCESAAGPLGAASTAANWLETLPSDFDTCMHMRLMLVSPLDAEAFSWP